MDTIKNFTKNVEISQIEIDKILFSDKSTMHRLKLKIKTKDKQYPIVTLKITAKQYKEIERQLLTYTHFQL